LWASPFLENCHKLYVKFYLWDGKHNDLIYITSLNSVRPFLKADFKWNIFYQDRLCHFSSLQNTQCLRRGSDTRGKCHIGACHGEISKETTVGCRKYLISPTVSGFHSWCANYICALHQWLCPQRASRESIGRFYRALSEFQCGEKVVNSQPCLFRDKIESWKHIIFL
jgi:hypothetical protein